MPQSFVPKWFALPLATLGVSTVGSSSSLPVLVSDVNTTQTVVTPPAGSGQIQPARLGINLAPASYSNTNRIFENLATGGGWNLVSGGVWGVPAADQLDADGNVIRLDGTDYATLPLIRPADVLNNKPVDIVCKWKGTGNLTLPARSAARNVVLQNHRLRFNFAFAASTLVYLKLSSVSATDPVRSIDCRETDADPNALFDPDYLASIKRFSTVRFMDWENTNDNSPVTWDTRTRPGTVLFTHDDGYPIEYMIALANQAKVNPWFNLPWNASDDYIRKFAETVRDTLDPHLTAYVEMSNEVWNPNFPVHKQSFNEAVAEGISDKEALGSLLRLAERYGQAMDIWTNVFQGQQSRLVRVFATQDGSTWSISQVMGFRDIGTKIDAFATAPYFPLKMSNYTDTPASLDQFFVDLRAKIDARLGADVNYRSLALSYGKRYITYEGGQSVTGTDADVDLMKKVERDPRMGQAYSYYLSQWQQNFGDLLMIYRDTGAVNKYGAWGMFEYAGQPLSQAPKARAVNLFMTSIGQ